MLRNTPTVQDKLAALAGPKDDLYSRAQQLEAAVKEKQAQLSAAAKQAAAALAAKEEAQQAARAERLRREAAEARAQQLQVRRAVGWWKGWWKGRARCNAVWRPGACPVQQQ